MYIENYRNTFMEQEFNFSSEYRFKYTKATQELNVEKNNLFIPDFFQRAEELEDGRGRIVNITGIIGKNGAGKTTVLDFIKENLVNGILRTGIRGRAIIVTKDHNGNGHMYYHTDFGLLQGNYRDVVFGVNQVPYHEIASRLSEETYVLTETTVIFYSTIFDAKQEQEWIGMRNISTNYLIREVKRSGELFQRRNSRDSETDLYRKNEIESQLRFILSQRSGDIDPPIQMPEYALVTPYALAHISKNASSDMIGDYPVEQFEIEILNWLHQVDDKLWSFHLLKVRFMRTIVGNFISDLVQRRIVSLNRAYFFERGIQLDHPVSDSKEIIYLMDVVQSFVQGLKNVDTYIMDLIHNIIKLLNRLEDAITLSAETTENALAVPLFPRNEGGISIADIFDWQDASMLSTPYFEFDWADLSSGQKALLSMYSRFYSLIDPVKMKSALPLSNNLLILIDEGELYLHPEWQRNFLNNLIEYLPKIYKGKNIQIIFTSNSPVIISDLPNSNLIFIDRSEKGCTVIDGLIEHKQTFAANIHTLYSDAFFMEKGLVGEFANKKILNLIHTIHSIVEKEEFIEVEKELDILISQIGEPVLRGKLHSLMKEKREKFIRSDRTNQELMNMIKSMQQEIDQLKKERSE